MSRHKTTALIMIKGALQQFRKLNYYHHRLINWFLKITSYEYVYKYYVYYLYKNVHKNTIWIVTKVSNIAALISFSKIVTIKTVYLKKENNANYVKLFSFKNYEAGALRRVKMTIYIS